MNISHLNFPQPSNKESVVWRYLSLQKYFDLICSRQLYLNRCDLFQDLLEGSLTQVNFNNYNVPFANPDDYQFKELIKKCNERYRYLVYANCWTIAETESRQMWNAYCIGKEGIAIKTTYEKLSTCNTDNTLFIGKITYLDYLRESIPNQYLQWNEMLNLFSHKEKMFEYESEIRIVKVDHKNADLLCHANFHKRILTIPKYIRINIENFEDLLKNIYLHPDSPDWHYDFVSSITNKFLPKSEVKCSTLKRVALF